MITKVSMDHLDRRLWAMLNPVRAFGDFQLEAAHFEISSSSRGRCSLCRSANMEKVLVKCGLVGRAFINAMNVDPKDGGVLSFILPDFDREM